MPPQRWNAAAGPQIRDAAAEGRGAAEKGGRRCKGTPLQRNAAAEKGRELDGAKGLRQQERSRWKEETPSQKRRRKGDAAEGDTAEGTPQRERCEWEGRRKGTPQRGRRKGTPRKGRCEGDAAKRTAQRGRVQAARLFSRVFLKSAPTRPRPRPRPAPVAPT